MNDRLPGAERQSEKNADVLELPDMEVVEAPFLLQGWQVSALEDAAHARGVTAGEMVRLLLGSFFLATRARVG